MIKYECHFVNCKLYALYLNRDVACNCDLFIQNASNLRDDMS